MTPGDIATLESIVRQNVAMLGASAGRMLRSIEAMEYPPQEVLGAARDLADYLDGSRPAPAENRHHIPHARKWDTRHALHLVKDLSCALDESREILPGAATPK